LNLAIHALTEGWKRNLNSKKQRKQTGDQDWSSGHTSSGILPLGHCTKIDRGQLRPPFQSKFLTRPRDRPKSQHRFPFASFATFCSKIRLEFLTRPRDRAKSHHRFPFASFATFCSNSTRVSRPTPRPSQVPVPLPLCFLCYLLFKFDSSFSPAPVTVPSPSSVSPLLPLLPSV
jgi:hypothetical protein